MQLRRATIGSPAPWRPIGELPDDVMCHKTDNFTDDDFKPTKESLTIMMGYEVDEDELKVLTKARPDYAPRPEGNNNYYYHYYHYITFTSTVSTTHPYINIISLIHE